MVFAVAIAGNHNKWYLLAKFRNHMGSGNCVIYFMLLFLADCSVVCR